MDCPEIIEAEAALRAAMLASDVEALDALLDDHVRYTDQFGSRLSKADDLAPHRSGMLDIQSIDMTGQPEIRGWGDCATVCVTVDLAGLYDGEAFFGR